jgi:hypothetical protein
MLIPRRRLPPDVVNMDELWSTQNLHRNAVNYFKINSEPDTILQDLTIKMLTSSKIAVLCKIL